MGTPVTVTVTEVYRGLRLYRKSTAIPRGYIYTDTEDSLLDIDKPLVSGERGAEATDVIKTLVLK